MAILSMDLLPGQGGVALRAPIHRRIFPVSQIIFIELNKKPFGPVIIFWICGNHFPAPVNHWTHTFYLGAHMLNILISPFFRVHAPGNGSIFRRQAKSIKTYREHHVISLHAFKTSPGIRRRYGIPMTNMQVSRWIGKHGHGIILFFTLINICFVKSVRIPFFLPLGFNFPRLISSAHCLFSWPLFDIKALNKKPSSARDEGRDLRGTTLLVMPGHHHLGLLYRAEPLFLTGFQETKSRGFACRASSILFVFCRHNW